MLLEHQVTVGIALDGAPMLLGRDPRGAGGAMWSGTTARPVEARPAVLLWPRPSRITGGGSITSPSARLAGPGVVGGHRSPVEPGAWALARTIGGRADGGIGAQDAHRDR